MTDHFEPKQKPFVMVDWVFIVIHFIALVATAFIIPLTTNFVQLVVIILFALLLVKTIKEWSSRY